VLALLPLGLTACGEDSSSPADAESDLRGATRDYGSEASGAQARRAEAVLNRYLGALAAARWGRACSYLTEPVRRLHARRADAGQKGEGCAAGLRTTADRLPPSERAGLGDADVFSVRVEADRGFAFYRTADKAEHAMPVRIEGGSWKLAAARVLGAPLEAAG
jgi:hypothetical protein